MAAAGTAAALVPIKSITMQSKDETFKYPLEDENEPGLVVKQLLNHLKSIQLGKVKDPFGWRESVREYKRDEYAIDGKGKELNGHAVGQLP